MLTIPNFILKLSVFFACFTPFFYVSYGIFHNTLGADPQKEMLLFFGEWAFRFLLVTLSISVVRRRLKFKKAIIFRRMIGLFVMFYATLHLTAYYWFYLGFSFNDLASEVVERPYLIVGFIAWVFLIPLTLTSTKKAMARLGKQWQKLHWLIYAIALLAWIHFFMQVKSDINEVLTYGVILFFLMLERVLFWRKKYWR